MKPKIAIIGAGWAGLAAAAQLSTQALVTVYEAASKQEAGREGLKTATVILYRQTMVSTCCWVLMSKWPICVKCVVWPR